MNYRVVSNSHQPTILTIGNDRTELAFNSTLLASFELVYATFEKQTLSWIQQHQPDLIVLDLEASQQLLSLIATLKLDWLTRDIPILAIANSAAQQLRRPADLDCDACLIRPYSTVELEQKLNSLLPSFNRIHHQAV